MAINMPDENGGNCNGNSLFLLLKMKLDVQWELMRHAGIRCY